MKTIKFINEVGNKIQVKIKDYNGVGENSKTKENIKFKGCEIQLIGPKSMSTNEITMQEAKMIYKMLGEYLDSKK